jgi:hypothetical protein
MTNRNIRIGGRCALLGAAVLGTQAPAMAGNAPFTVIGLPDTQFYSESYPDIFAAQTWWVADNVEALNIEFVSHYGDVVQHGNGLPEWDNAEIALQVLDSIGIPWGVSAGNHDVTPGGGDASGYIPQFFEQRYGESHWAGRPWFVGCSPSGMSNAQMITAGGREWLWIHIECDTAPRELAWAQGILDVNRDKAAVMTTHRWLQDAEDYTAGVPIVPSGRYPDIWYTFEDLHVPDGLHTDDAWKWFLRQNPSIFMLNCGHFHEQYRQTSTNVKGLPIFEVLADYQDDPNGGNGWLRIMQFDVDSDQINFDSYSPTLDQFRTEDEGRFTLNVNFDDYRLPDGRAFAAFQQGVNRYDGTRDTWISEADPNTSYGNDGVKYADDDVNNGIFSDERGQTMVKFTGVFTEDGAGSSIPLGVQIVEAYLRIELANDIDHPIFDPDFYVYEMITPWDENSTWNSMNNGLSLGQDLGTYIGSFPGDNNPDGDYMRRINVTQTVQHWSDGQPNHGFAVLPEIISGNDDGISIFTSESGNPLIHPRLEIIYIAPELPCVADFTGAGDQPDGVVDTADFFALLQNWGVCPAQPATCPWDIDGPNGIPDEVVGTEDFFMLLQSWGPCE